METAIALIDGEHYPPVVKASLEDLEKRFQIKALVFLGGTEKVGTTIPDEQFGLPLIHKNTRNESLQEALEKFIPQNVIDLSDEPVLGYIERFELANISLLHNANYIGSDFKFSPPRKEDICEKPSISIIGTGKRVGKTAVSAYACRVIKKKGTNPIVIAMGRGGPKEPDILDGSSIEIDAGYLLKMADEGKHAASDYFEDAMMSRVMTVGCRRCGGGLAGEVFISNVVEGTHVANDLAGDMIVLEGSGSAIPPVKTDATIITIAANQPYEYISGYFGPYRIRSSDLAIVTNCEQPCADEQKVDQLADAIKNINSKIKIVKTVFRPKPLEDLSGKKVFFATTAPSALNDTLSNYLENNFDCRIIHVSNHLSNRGLLKESIDKYSGKFDTLLTELKAAAVDVVARIGLEIGSKTIFCDNIPIPLNNQDLDSEILDLANLAKNRFVK